MRADIAERLALFMNVEEPRRTLERRAGDELLQKMYALVVDARLIRRARQRLAENITVLYQFALEDRRDLVALGHDVVGDQALAIRVIEHFLQARQMLRDQYPRLVGEQVQSGADGGFEVVNLPRIPPREHDNIAGFLLGEPLQEIRRGVQFELPVRRMLCPRVEPGNALQMANQVRT